MSDFDLGPGVVEAFALEVVEVAVVVVAVVVLVVLAGMAGVEQLAGQLRCGS